MLLRQDYRNYNKAPDIYTKLEYHKGRANAFNGSSFTNGGLGGSGNSCYSTAEGGFGGGGAGGLGSPGGGGGYSGGASAGYWSSYANYGGGGGSYNSGSNQMSQVMNSGTGYGPTATDGVVTITKL